MNTPEDHQGADLEVSCQTLELILQVGTTVDLVAQYGERHQQLGRDPIAPALHFLIRCRPCFGVGDGGLPKPQVREFVREGEHLRLLGVRPVDEDQRREWIGQRKAAELPWIEAAAVVAADDTTGHHQDAERIRLPDEVPQRVGPRGEPATLLNVEPENMPHGRGDLDDVVLEVGGANDVKRRLVHGHREVAIPVLALVAQIDGLQQIRAWMVHVDVSDGAEVRDRHPFDRRFREKQESHRRTGRLRKRLDLLESGLYLAPFPRFKPREATRQGIGIVARALARPAEQRGLDGDAVHLS